MQKSESITRVGIFGSGNIGTDLLAKLLRTTDVAVDFIVGRREDSPGIALAKKAGVPVFISGLDGLKVALENFPVHWLADTSSAETHLEVRKVALNHPMLRILDFTPSALSTPYCPGSLELLPDGRDIGLISCGGQSAIPLVACLRRRWEIKSVELTSALSSRSVGPATRANLNEYITKTRKSLCYYSGTDDAKVILIVNPASPPINMRVSLYVQFHEFVDPDDVDSYIENNLDLMNDFVPNFTLLGKTSRVGDDLLISFEVTGYGDYLPKYAGNLDILTHTAVKIFADVSRRSNDSA